MAAIDILIRCLSPCRHMRQTGQHLGVALNGILAFLLVCVRLCAQDAGFGPPISVPHDLTEAKARPLPAKNWFDQAPEDAMRNSRGCLECHTGIDTLSKHASTDVVLGCTQCHGAD